MVVTAIGGGPASNAATQTGQRRSVGAWRSVWRVVPSRTSTRSATLSSQGHRCGWPARAFTLTSEPAMTASVDVQTGSDLNDMCTLQLGMLYQLLARAGTNYTAMRCAVYARNFTAVGLGQVKLVRVAQFPVVPGQHDDSLAQQQQQSTLLLHTEQSWALQGGSAALNPSAMIEDCLLHREVVALPSSSALVFPLVDGGVLVGLLVVELETEADGDRERERASELRGSSVLAAPGDGGGVETRALELLDSRPRRSLTDEELQCLRLSVPLLAKACGMDARASWQLAQSSIGAAAAAGLLREAQRPLSTLNTFSTMLIPRLKDGDPDKDIAKGILTQGKRLQDLMWQLEDALHGAAAPSGQSPGGLAMGGMPSSIPIALPGAGALPHPPVVNAPPFRTPSALPRDPSPAIQELLQLPSPRPVATPPAPGSPGPQQQQQPAQAAADTGAQPPASDAAAASLTEATGPSSADAGAGGPGPVLPGRVTFIERAALDSTPGTLADGGAFTIRQPPGRASAGGPHAGPGRPFVGSGGPGAATATIDVEMDTCEPRAVEPGAAAGPLGPVGLKPEGRSAAHQATALAKSSSQLGGAASQLPFTVNTNLASALAGVLTAAYRLATVSGIGFIVNSPLSAILPRRGGGTGTGGSSGKTRSAPAATSPSAPAGGESPSPGSTGRHPELGGSAAQEAASKPRLIPRPVRPLVVQVRPALVQVVVGYMLDIALQCTPRGGQVCVSARQDGGGVQLQVLHSGRMDLHRLHARSRSMATPHAPVGATAAAAPAPAAVAPSAHASGRGGGAAATAVVQRTAQQALATGRGGDGQAGSGVLSVELAQELAHQAGGYLTVSYPFNMVNAQSGSLDVGTSVEIWLPGPAAAAAGAGAH